ncbi:MAG: RluA family pseudouridine synthase [Desulfuromonadales bacterium]|nr:RluA family pseudouridine synthase [Desulfuromonadales bacterium]
MIFKVAPGESGQTVIDFLRLRVPAAPQAYLQQLVKKGKVRRSTQPLGLGDTLRGGDVLRLPDSGRLRELCETPVPFDKPVAVLYESREILVVDKPAGLAVHSSQGHEQSNLTSRVEELLSRRGDRFSVAPVHRLDLETSGPVLFGKGRQACAELGKMFMRREVEKYYLAMVSGETRGAGRLCSDVPAKGKQKQALTEFRALLRNRQASLLEIRLGTGRQHQIRRQLAQAGHPLFGDLRYGGPCPNMLARLFLHSCRLSFVDPFSGAQLDLESDLPFELALFRDTLFPAD